MRFISPKLAGIATLNSTNKDQPKRLADSAVSVHRLKY